MDPNIESLGTLRQLAEKENIRVYQEIVSMIDRLQGFEASCQSLENKEVVLFLGLSNCGKSTILNALVNGVEVLNSVNNEYEINKDMQEKKGNIGDVYKINDGL